MTRLYTASWRALYETRDRLDVVPVRISRGAPRFWPQAATFPYLDDLAPDAWTLGVYKKVIETDGPEIALEKFGRCYRAKLHRIGLDQIRAQLDELGELYCRPLALCCFEADPDECHRGPLFGFARWWQAKTGQAIPEWHPARLQLEQPAPATGV